MNMLFKNIFEKLVQKTTYLANGYSSSAKNLQDFLDEMGVVTPVRVWHRYVYPENMTPAEYEHRVQSLHYVLTFDSEQVMDPDVYAVRVFSYGQEADADKAEMMNAAMDYADTLKGIVGKLTPAQRQEFIHLVISERPYALEMARQEVAKLKKLNPELQGVQIDETDILSLFGFLEGVNYGDDPMDIQYFCDMAHARDTAPGHEANKKLEKEIGRWVGLFIHPQRIDLLTDAVRMAKVQHRQSTQGRE